MGPDANDCATQESCPAPGAMTTEELQRWADRLREVRETKRCTPETCKAEEKKSAVKFQNKYYWHLSLFLSFVLPNQYP